MGEGEGRPARRPRGQVLARHLQPATGAQRGAALSLSDASDVDPIPRSHFPGHCFSTRRGGGAKSGAGHLEPVLCPPADHDQPAATAPDPKSSRRLVAALGAQTPDLDVDIPGRLDISLKKQAKL